MGRDSAVAHTSVVGVHDALYGNQIAYQAAIDDAEGNGPYVTPITWKKEMTVRVKQFTVSKSGNLMGKPYFMMFDGKVFGPRFGSEETAQKAADKENVKEVNDARTR